SVRVAAGAERADEPAAHAEHIGHSVAGVRIRVRLDQAEDRRLGRAGGAVVRARAADRQRGRVGAADQLLPLDVNLAHVHDEGQETHEHTTGEQEGDDGRDRPPVAALPPSGRPPARHCRHGMTPLAWSWVPTMPAIRLSGETNWKSYVSVTVALADGSGSSGHPEMLAAGVPPMPDVTVAMR